MSQRTATTLPPAENRVDSPQDQVEFGARQPSYAFGKEILIDGDDLRDISHRILREAGDPSKQLDISRGQRPFEVAGQRNADDGVNTTLIEGVTLHHNYRPAESRPGASRGGKVRPPNLAL